ncbi:hypothetical protein ACFLV7_07055 [Chloroflexota bacterium]
MKHKGLIFRTMLILVLMLVLTLPGVVGAQDPEPKDPFPELADPDNPSGSGDAEIQELPLTTEGNAGAVHQVNPTSLKCAHVIDFSELEMDNYDGIIDLEGASFAERFVGQALSYDGDFDILSGTPSDPLTLQVGAPDHNIYIIGDIDSRLIAGLGRYDYPNIEAVGEGAVAVLYDSDQYEIGLQIWGTNNGDITINFFRRDGSIIDTIVFQSGNWPTYDDFAFRRAGNIADIAGISIHNTDPGGIALDNFVMCLQTQPEPVKQVDPATLTCPHMIDFGELGVGNYDGIIDMDGANFAERFTGQELTYDEEFDILSDTASDPLTLQVGDPNRNLGITGDASVRVIYGIGEVDVPPESAVGEGAVAVLFDSDQYEIGFQLVADWMIRGDVTANFFRMDGSLIDTIVFTSDWDDFAFRRDGNTADIAGVSIHNTDPGGIGFDNFVMCFPQFPDPAALLEYILELPDEVFENNANQRKSALNNKLDEVSQMIEDCEYGEAISKLTGDIRAKADGTVDGKPYNDWIINPDVQAEFCAMIDELIAWLEENPCP